MLRAETGAGSTADRGVLAVRMRSDGRHYQALYVDGGVSSTQTSGHLRMQGREVFRHAVANLAEIAGEALEAAGVGTDEVDWLVPHQANRRIIDATGKKLGIPAEKTIVTVDRHANTSSASIPLALNAGIDDGGSSREICWWSRRSAAGWFGAPASSVCKTLSPPDN